MDEFQVLTATQSTGDTFACNATFVVFLDTFAAGWFLEYALYKPQTADIVWKKYHSQPFQEHGELSRVAVNGTNNMLFRMNSGTTGATAYREIIH